MFKEFAGFLILNWDVWQFCFVYFLTLIDFLNFWLYIFKIYFIIIFMIIFTMPILSEIIMIIGLVLFYQVWLVRSICKWWFWLCKFISSLLNYLLLILDLGLFLYNLAYFILFFWNSVDLFNLWILKACAYFSVEFGLKYIIFWTLIFI